MGRSRKPLELSTGRPYGQRWTRYRAGLVAAWWRAGRTCYYCAHGFSSPELIEAAHLISPIVAPALAWSRDNLVPAHGSGKRRCQTQDCLLACNYVAAIAPDAPKDEHGADLPFTPEFLARQARGRGQFLGKPAIPGKSRPIVVPFREMPPDKGREW